MAAIAEAFVRLRPDLSRFNAELQAGVAAAVANVKTQPVRILAQVVTQAGAATAAVQGTGAASAAAGSAAVTAANQTATANAQVTQTVRARNAAIDRLLVAETSLAKVTTAGAAAASELGAAQSRATAAIAANVTAMEAYTLATLSGDAATIQMAKQLALNTALEEAYRVSLIQEARAQNEAASAAGVHRTQLLTLARGGAAAALAATGLRGATLAATAPFLAGAAAVTALFKSLQSFGQLQTTLNTFQAVTGATADEMNRVSDAARQLGADLTLPAVNAQDAATAILELSKAGLSVQESISGARGVLQLATAAGIDNAQATELVANSLNAFSLAGQDAVEVADLLANAANLAQGEITDFGQAQAQVNAVASQVGVSLQDEVAILTLLARAGLRGSDAGTSLRTAFIRLIAPTAQARREIERLGLQVRDASGDLRPEIFADFAKATEQLAPDIRDALAAEIFGQDAIRAALLAGRAGVQGLREVQKGVAEQGTAADVAGAKTKGLAGSLENLKNQGSTLAQSIGGVLAPGFKNILDGASAAAKGVNDLTAAQKSLNTEIQGATGAAEGVKAGQSTVEIAKQIQNLRDIQRASLDAGQQPSAFTVQAIAFLSNVLQSRLAPALRETAQDAGGLTFELSDATSRAHTFVPAINDAADAVGRFGNDLARVQNLDVLSSELQSSLQFLKEAGPGATGPQIDIAKQVVQDRLDQLRNLTGGMQRILEQGPSLAEFFGGEFRAAAAEFTGFGELVKPTLTNEMRDIIDALALTPQGRQQLRETGAELTRLMAEGVEDNTDAITAARKAVRDAITAAREQVQDSIRSARTNLESLAGTLEQQIQQVFDAAPPTAAAKSLDDLREALARLQEQTERRQLRFNLSQAQQDLEDARNSIRQLGAATTPEQQQARAEFLAPFIEKVKDAQAAQKEFNLEDTISDQEKLQEAAKKAATEGIERLVEQFDAGKISADKFAARLRTQLQPQIAALRNNPNLGLRFSREFLRTLRTVVAQAKELAGFRGVPGTEPGATVVSPADAQRQSALRVADAQAALQKTLRNNNTATNNNTAAVKLLTGAIRTAVRGARTAGDPGRDTPDVIPTNK